MFVSKAALKSGCDFMGKASFSYTECLTPNPIGRFPARGRSSVLCIRFPHVQEFQIISGDRCLRIQVE